MYFLELLSDGNVHSHIDHLKALTKKVREDGVKEVRIHALLDGRDIPETSALTYVDNIETYMTKLNDGSFRACIASGSGRMAIVMDRYEANWAIIEQGWHMHMPGEGRKFTSTKEVIEAYHAESGVVDQDLSEFVVAKDGKSIGTIENGDSVILFNFHGDRAQEIPPAFDGDDSFDRFDRVRMPKVMFTGMLQYDANLSISRNSLTYPPKIKYTLTEELYKRSIREYTISRTQKFGHVTYFWNGSHSEKLDEKLEDYVEIKSDVIPFEQRP